MAICLCCPSASYQRGLVTSCPVVEERTCLGIPRALVSLRSHRTLGEVNLEAAGGWEYQESSAPSSSLGSTGEPTPAAGSPALPCPHPAMYLVQ